MPNVTNPIPLIIDTDPGVDDATAIMLALSHPEAIDLKLLSSVGGNVEIEKTTHNCRILLDFLHARDVPVAQGGTAAEATPAVEVHGVHGLGVGDPWEYGRTRWEQREADGETGLEGVPPAVEAQAQVLRDAPVPVTIVAIGPLTNIARLLREHPELHRKIDRIVFMGGAIGRGNKAPYTEFNIGSDPDAAAYVLSHAGVIPLVMLPLEVADAATLRPETLRRLGGLNPVGAAIAALMGTPEPGNPDQGTKAMYDPTTIAYLCRPDLFTAARHRVVVETQGTHTRGATVTYDYPQVEKGIAREPADGVLVCSRVENSDEVATEEGCTGFARWLFESVHHWDDKDVG